MNIFGVLSQYNSFRQNPMQMLSRKFKIPEGVNNPDEILKHLVDSKQVSQGQLEQINQMANMFRR